MVSFLGVREVDFERLRRFGPGCPDDFVQYWRTIPESMLTLFMPLSKQVNEPLRCHRTPKRQGLCAFGHLHIAYTKNEGGNLLGGFMSILRAITGGVDWELALTPLREPRLELL